MRTLWQPTLPEELRELVEPLLEGWRSIIPPWIECLTVDYDATPKENGVAGCVSQYGYRTASLVIFPAWLNETDYDREVAIVHELCHITTSPMYTIPENLLAQIPDAALRTTLTKAFEEAVEAVVCDLSIGYMRACYGEEEEEES